MSFNFPASPSNGQTYEPVNGPVFTWDGTAWKALSQGMPVTVFVADTPPAAPSFGNLWWESDTGNLFIYYNDGDSAQWVQINGTPAGYQTADSRNRIVNGAMQISQENGTTNVGNAAYPTDQWIFLNTTGATATARQDLLPAASITSRLRVNTTVADATHAAAENISVRTAIEGTRIVDFGWGTVNAKPVVLRFAAVAPVAGIYSVAVRNIPSTESWIGSYTIAPEEVGGWVWRTLVIPPCSTGTWASDTSGGLYLLFTIAAGPSNTGVLGWQTANLISAPGQANGVSVAGNFFVSNVGLYLDPDNTGVAPKWQMPDEAEELRACMRYWQKSYEMSDRPGTATSNASIQTTAAVVSTTQVGWSQNNLPVRMRVALTAGTLYNVDGTSGQVSLGAAPKLVGQIAGGSETGFWTRCTTATGLVVGQCLPFGYHWIVNARM